MGNIAETVKKQTDRILRQQNLNGTGGVVVSGVATGTGAPAPTVDKPAADLTAHKSSADHDGRYYTEDEVDGLLNFVGLSDTPAAYTGEGGKIVAVKADVSGLEFVAAPPATNGIPTGGTNNQLLAKDGATDYVVKWMDAPAAANGLPEGGTAGQILAKVDGTDHNAHWIDAPSGGGWDSLITWDVSTTTEGIDRTHTSSASTYTSVTAVITTYRPIKITNIYWDIFAADTYTLSFNGAAIADAVVVTAQTADVDFALTTPLFLPVPGKYLIMLTWANAAKFDYNSAADYYGNYWSTSDSLSNNAYNNVLAPIKLKAYLGAWK